MIEVKRNSRGIAYSQKWFARTTAPSDAWKIVAYYQYLGAGPGSPFFRRPFTTILIDLQRDPTSILGEMQASVRSQIRRAEGEGLAWENNVDPREFAAFHSAFARERGIEGVDPSQLRSFGAALLLTRVALDGKILAQHAYVVDPVESRARNLYSSSGRFDGPDSHLVGRANRWCHYKDMLHLRGLGIRTYDFGGIAVGEGTAAVSGINDFKTGFGGTKAREDHWMSPLYALSLLLRGKQ